MTTGERIKEVRKVKSLTLEEFGGKIGIKKSASSKIERGESNPSDQTIKSICREFEVSETWLRTGEGEMFPSRTRDADLAEMVNRLLSNMPEDFQRRLTTALSRLSAQDWEAFDRFLSDLAAERKKVPPETWDGKTREEIHAELDRRLDKEKELALSRHTAAEAPPDAASQDTMMEAG